MIRVIDKNDLKSMITKHEKFTLVDVLSHESFVKAHIPGAINLPLDEFDLKAEDVLKKDENIVIYCGNQKCTMSSAASEKLEHMGFYNIMDYEGGLKEWQDSGCTVTGEKDSLMQSSCTE